MKKKNLHRITINTKAVSSWIKKWRTESGIIDYRKQKRCPVCGENMVLTFEKHHIDGNPNNNSKDNLVKLCASCHAITYNARSREETKKAFKKRHDGWKRKQNRGRKAWLRKRKSGAKYWSPKHRIKIKK